MPSPGNQEPTLATQWGLSTTSSAFFRNARSALHALLRYLAPQRVWLPAYVCEAICSAVPMGRNELHYYPLDQQLRPQLDHLKRNVRDGEAMLLVDYFGRGG